MIKLPEEFLNNMQILLKDEFDNFLKTYDKTSHKALRVNTLKCSVEKLKSILNFDITPTEFSNLSFYIPNDITGIGKSPLFHAGAFYVQEPSASSAVTVLSPKPGDRVLDLCAAPGGKSTQIAAALESTGLLWSNEIVKSRAKILLSNIERMGVKNAVVSSCHPDVLCSKLEDFFDKILVDAPCSGEGMFKKEPKAITEWSPNHVKTCASRQLSILNTAAKALKPNGIMVYSTCTFSKEENEGVIDKFLKENHNFELIEITNFFGRPGYSEDNPDMYKTRRIYPMDNGEGHFIAKLQKSSGNEKQLPMLDYSSYSKAPKEAFKLYDDLFNTKLYGHLVKLGNNIIILPSGLPDISNLPILRAGVLFGEIKKSRIEPAHSVFMASKPDDLKNVVDFKSNSQEIINFLKGQELEAPEELSGFIGVSVESIMVGFGKCSNGRLKNRYPKGLRLL